MNRKKMLKIIGALVGLMILFPPITIVRYYGRETSNAYAFLLSLPPNASLNVPTLLIQIFGALIIGGIAYASIGKD